MNAKQLSTPLSRKAVLVSVNISQWTARKVDKAVTEKVNADHEAANDAGRYNKLLIDSKHLSKLTALVRQARELHYTMTLPWMDEGPRILANVLFVDFSNQFRTIKREFEREAATFTANYATYVDERRKQLGRMFKDSDYPSPTEMRKRFKMDLVVLPLPDAGDFRVEQLDDDIVDQLRNELAETTRDVERHTLQETARQIVEVVGHMNDQLKKYTQPKDGKRAFFMNSLVDNVRDLAKLLPAFNLTDDPELAKITKRIVNELCVEDAETLRRNEDVCVTVQKSADQIVKAVGGLLG
jgi:hypothetical protein